MDRYFEAEVFSSDNALAALRQELKELAGMPTAQHDVVLASRIASQPLFRSPQARMVPFVLCLQDKQDEESYVKFPFFTHGDLLHKCQGWQAEQSAAPSRRPLMKLAKEMYYGRVRPTAPREFRLCIVQVPEE